jgi:hypothetical protein
VFIYHRLLEFYTKWEMKWVTIIREKKIKQWWADTDGKVHLAETPSLQVDII